MSKRLRICVFAAALLVLMFPPSRLSAGPGRDDDNGRDLDIKHVLLISIDGMHAVDYENCKAAGTCPTLAALGMTGVNYTRTTTSRPSDSFPGLMALVTGGSPRTVGAFYDVAYDRVLAPPVTSTGNGLPGSGKAGCTQGTPNGTQTEYEEGVEIDQSKVNGGGPYAPFDGGVLSIDPNKLERDPFNGCNPVYPWNFIRTNTIYGVLHASGRFTAWSDKHPVYAAVSGPTGTNTPSNVDDYYAPEVNSLQVPVPRVTTAGDNFNCANLAPNGDDWTTDFQAIQCYDQLKVNAVVNWINGRSHLGDTRLPVPAPAVLGMNFQAVSVGQKLIEKPPKAGTPINSQNCVAAFSSGMKCFGGYTDAAATPTPAMQGQIKFVDAAIGQMVAALKNRGLLESTAIIITAKHGQSPIDPNRFFEPPTSPAAVLAGVPGLLPSVVTDPNNTLGLAEDDISQLWLADSTRTVEAVNALEANARALNSDASPIGLGQIYYGPSLETMFNAAGVPKNTGPCCHVPGPGDGDSRTPDITVIPNVGVVYTTSGKKQSEHGGFAHDDTNVMLLVSNPSLSQHSVNSFVETAQVAPTILKLLGLDPRALEAVRIEGTPVLPHLF